MKIFLNKPRAFGAGVILRTLYYSTGFHDIVVHIDGLTKIDSMVRYSRVPIKKIIENVKFSKPETFGNYVIVDPKSDVSWRDIDWLKINTIVVDFANEIEGKRVRALGLDILHYEAIALFYYLFIRNKKWEVNVEFEQEVNREIFYIAKKLLEGIQWFDNFYLIPPRIIAYALKHLHKKYGIIVDYKDVEIKIDPVNGNLEMKFKIEFYNRKLEKIHESNVLLKNNEIEIPIYWKKERRYKFVIDWDRRRIYISKNSYIDLGKEKEEVLKDFEFL